MNSMKYVIFRIYKSDNFFRVNCYDNEKISDIILKYRNLSGDTDDNTKFVYNAKSLNPTLNFSEAGLVNGAHILVVKTKSIKSINTSEVKSDNNNDINTLKQELNNAKKIINIQKMQINENIKLKEELNNIKKIIESKDNIIHNLENKLINSKNNYNYEIAKKNSLIEFLQNKLKEVEKELENIKNNNSNINKEKMIKESQIAVINFISSDQKVHYAISCLKSSIFAEIEEKLYKVYPEYRETNNAFFANGKNILRFKTISENGIKNGFPVMLIQP